MHWPLVVRLFFTNRGEFHTSDYEEIIVRRAGLSLLSNIVLEWNTIAIGNMFGQFRAEVSKLIIPIFRGYPCWLTGRTECQDAPGGSLAPQKRFNMGFSVEPADRFAVA